MDNLMDIGKVLIQLEYLKEEFELKAQESGDFAFEYICTHKAKVLESAIEYLWQYEDLMQ